jgi:hypothetical protein
MPPVEQHRVKNQDGGINPPLQHLNPAGLKPGTYKIKS